MWQRPQYFGVEGFIGWQIHALDPQKVLDRSGDVVAFYHFGCPLQGPFEPFLRHLGMLTQANAYVGDEAYAQRGRVQNGTIAGYNPSTLQLLHPTQARRGRQTNTISEIEVANAAILRELMQYLLVYFINLRH